MATVHFLALPSRLQSPPLLAFLSGSRPPVPVPPPPFASTQQQAHLSRPLFPIAHPAFQLIWPSVPVSLRPGGPPSGLRQPFLGHSQETHASPGSSFPCRFLPRPCISFPTREVGVTQRFCMWSAVTLSWLLTMHLSFLKSTGCTSFLLLWLLVGFQNGLPLLKSCPETQESRTFLCFLLSWPRGQWGLREAERGQEGKVPLHFLSTKRIPPASPRSPSMLGKINLLSKYYRGEVEAHHTLGKCHPFPLRGSSLVNAGQPSRQCCDVTARTQVCWDPAGGPGQAQSEQGTTEKLLPTSPQREGGVLPCRMAAIWSDRWREALLQAG